MSEPKRIELPTGLPIGTVNAYLFSEPEPVLVDTGLYSEESLQALEAGLAEHHLSIPALSRVIISHPHVDHCGLAAIIAERSQADIYILKAAKPWLIDYHQMWRRRVAYYTDSFFIEWGLPPDIAGPILDYMSSIEHNTANVPPERIVTFEVEETLPMGGLSWRVLHTPGHASTLTCFFQSNTRQFLSADMLLPQTPTPIVEAPPEGHTERIPSLPQFLESLALVEQLDCEKVYPGHGDPFIYPQAVIQRQRERIAMRKEECLALIKQNVQTVGDLLLAMYPHYPPRFRFAGLWMVIGYLDLLMAEERIKISYTDEDTKHGAKITAVQ